MFWGTNDKEGRSFYRKQSNRQNDLWGANSALSKAATDVRSQSSTQKRIYPMSRFIKVLPAIALAIGLAPVAAQAQTAPQPTHGGYHTVVHSGVSYFRDSFGG
jgi:hypothetical protein